MKLGINLLLWTAAAGEADLPRIENIRSWGFDGVEFPMFSPACSPWPRLATALDAMGLGRTAVTILPEDGSLISGESAERRKGLDHLKACVEACAVLGAPILSGPLYSPCGRLVGRGPNQEEWKRAVEGLRAAGEHAAQASMALAIEPLNRFETYFLNCQADAVRLAEEIQLPNVGVMFDTFHANIEEKSPAGAIQTAAPRLRHVHISANDRATPGEDHIPWPEVFSALKRAGYDGWLTIEAFGRALPEVAAATCIWRSMAPNEDHIARAGAQFIRRAWSAA